MNRQSNPRISFGIIVLNGEPFTKYCLRQLYPFAHEIIVVEGGSKKAANFAPNGHSTDGTLEALYEFKKVEDPEGKVKIITKDGFWEEKDEQSQAYAKEVTGDYLWQVDIDEFYKAKDMEYISSMLREKPEIDIISFGSITFWGGFDYWCDSLFLRDVFTDILRIFKWKSTYKYVTHRPPTIIDEQGIDLRTKNWLTARKTARLEIFMYHYSLLFPKQVKEKCDYYSKPGGAHNARLNSWANECYFKLSKPFMVHNVDTYPSWLMRYRGSHPEQIETMKRDIATKILDIETRSVKDIDELLNSKLYRTGISTLKLLDYLLVFRIVLQFRNIFKRIIK